MLNAQQVVLIFIFSILLLNGCRTESNIDENKNIQTNIPQKKLRLKDVPELKNILTSNPKLFNKRVKFSINDSIEVFNINSKKLNSYSVQINPDNDSAFYIVTLSYDKLKNNKVSKLIGKFVPDNNTFEKNIKNFSGKSYFETITGTPIVNSIWKNGKVIDNKNIRNAKTASCTTQSYIVANMCSEDVHWPWEGGCQASGKAYFSISTSMNCDQEMIDPNWGGGGFGDSGGGGSNSIATMSSPDAINYLLAQIGMTSLNTQQYNFLASYPIIADYFKTYFWGDNQNIDGANFMNWGINFFMQNPNTTIEQFQNWFMGESEGQDGEYDLASEIAFQQQQFQKHSLPSMTSYENAFPSNPNATYPNYYRDAAPNYEVYNNYVGGRLKQLFNQNGGNIIGNPYRNACAVRQSFTHNKLGIMIPFQHNDHKGDYNWNYILTASKMGVFLEGTYGPPTHKLIGTDANDLKKIGDFLKGKTGIYLVINNDPSKNTGAGYTGHTDMIKNGYVSGGANVTNSSGQIVRGGIKYIYIWELK